MTANIAEQYCIPYFSQWETAGGPAGTISVWKTGPTVRVNDRDAEGPMVFVPGIRGNVAPRKDADLDITDNAGRRREGDIEIYCIEPLQVDDEATGETSWFVLHRGYYYVMDTQDAWHYAGGHVYQAFRDRRASNV